MNSGIGDTLNKEAKRLGGKTLIDAKLEEFMAQQNDTFQLTCADSTVAEVKGGLVSQEQVDIIYDEQHAHFLKSIRNLKETGIFAECVDNNKDIQAK